MHDLFNVEGLSVLLVFRPNLWHSRLPKSPHVLTHLVYMNVIVMVLPFPWPVVYIVPHSHVLKVKPFISKLARVKVGLQHKVGNLHKFAAQCGWCGQSVHLKNSLTGLNPLQLIVEHDLITVFVDLLIIQETVRAAELELVRDIDAVTRVLLAFCVSLSNDSHCSCKRAGRSIDHFLLFGLNFDWMRAFIKRLHTRFHGF